MYNHNQSNHPFPFLGFVLFWVLTLIPIFLLSAPAHLTNPTAARFIINRSADLRDTPFTIVVHEYTFPADIHEQFLIATKKQAPDNQIGFMERYQTPTGFKCEIHVLETDTLDDPRLSDWGHELLHCVVGEFHAPGAISYGRVE